MDDKEKLYNQIKKCKICHNGGFITGNNGYINNFPGVSVMGRTIYIDESISEELAGLAEETISVLKNI